MIALTLAEIGHAVEGRICGPDGFDSHVPAAGVVRIDSRDVQRGDLFAAVTGDALDGHDFVEQALALGAIGSLVARPVPGSYVLVDDVVEALARLARANRAAMTNSTVVGITGSSGKTTTKDMLAAVLESFGPTVSTPGNFNNEIGMPLTILRADETAAHLVLEMGARGPGHIRELCDIATPDVAVVLNVGTAHIGEFGSREAIADAKFELVSCLGPAGVAVLNADDERVAAMALRTPAPVLRFGENADANVRASNIAMGADGCPAFTVDYQGVRAPVRLNFVGRHQVSNALAAIAAAIACGYGLPEIVPALEEARPRSPWRMEVTVASSGIVVLNDAYNANPDSMRAALDSLRELAGERRAVAVLGEMAELGPQSETAHRELGAEVARLGIARLVGYGSLGYTIVAGAVDAGLRPDSTTVTHEPGAATAAALRGLRAGDVVLVKGSRVAALEQVAAGLLTARLDGQQDEGLDPEGLLA
jgi:UDP-N-acetylmuramoyl-tripeptide--D-alanyl-D-alanine ligase